MSSVGVSVKVQGPPLPWQRKGILSSIPGALRRQSGFARTGEGMMSPGRYSAIRPPKTPDRRTMRLMDAPTRPMDECPVRRTPKTPQPVRWTNNAPHGRPNPSHERTTRPMDEQPVPWALQPVRRMFGQSRQIRTVFISAHSARMAETAASRESVAPRWGIQFLRYRIPSTPICDCPGSLSKNPSQRVL